MRTWVLAAILALVLSLLCARLQEWLRRSLARRPQLVFLAPALLTILFSLVAASEGAFNLPLLVLVTVYLFLPTSLAYRQGAGPTHQPSSLDFVVILLLWLPIEFAAGGALIPRPVQGFLHSVAYGMAILLALVIFLGFRAWSGLKYRLPTGRDLLFAIVGFAASAPVLIVVGRALGFIPAWHAPIRTGAWWMTTHFLVILVATGLPEEILFRSLVQNGLAQRYGNTTTILLVASIIFGCAHLNNGPQPLPNWRYMILATIAGFAYGKVFQRSSSVWGSATLHAMVDWTKHLFF